MMTENQKIKRIRKRQNRNLKIPRIRKRQNRKVDICGIRETKSVVNSRIFCLLLT